MLTEYEAHKLQRQMQRELEAGSETVWWCTAGLLMLLALLLLGTSTINGSWMGG
jgi:hypothetical protein